MNHPLGIKPSPQPHFACGGRGTRLSNKINAAGSTNPVIWTALSATSPAITIVIKARNLPADLSDGRYEKSRYASSSFLSMWFFPCEHALAMAWWNLFPIREIPLITTPTRRIFD
jgi:hypothetical protein